MNSVFAKASDNDLTYIAVMIPERRTDVEFVFVVRFDHERTIVLNMYYGYMYGNGNHETIVFIFGLTKNRLILV